MQSKRGFTLVEMLLIMAAPVVGLGIPANSNNSDLKGPTLDALLARAASETGCPVQYQQTVVVYASSSGFGFEMACGGEKTRNRTVAYTPGATTAARPDTITFFFQPDSSTPRTDDFALMRRLNGDQPVAELRNLLVYGGRPFLEYYYRSAEETTQPVPATWLPLRHTSAGHATAADTGLVARIDTLRAVEVNYSISNSDVDSDERVHPVSNVIALSNLSRKRDRLCDGEPNYIQSSWAAPAAYGMMSRAAMRSALSSDNCTTI